MSERMLFTGRRILLLGLICVAASSGPLRAADDNDTATAAAEEKKLPVIADEPKTIDPASLMPAKLAGKVTVDFADSSLREVVEWLRTEQRFVVLLDETALTAAGISLSEPISDRLNDAPVYLLLNRMSALGLGWYYENEILHVTTAASAKEHFQTDSINIADLLDAGYTAGRVTDAIQITVAPETWEDVGGPGAVSMLGDVLFIRQTEDVLWGVRGLLAALKEHGRQTYVFDPPEHSKLREKLEENVSVDFVDTPLVDAVQKLAADTGIDIRLDRPELREHRIREREPITLKLTDRKLKTVLQAMLLNLKLTWILQDGVLWITSQEKATETLKTVVYDVRDLCRDDEESASLEEAITSQSHPDSWDITGGAGTLDFAKAGTLAVRARDDVHRDLLHLLESYRAALRASKPRQRDALDLTEVVKVYYRMDTNMANDLQFALQRLVQPETWKVNELARAAAAGEEPRDVPGEITMVSSQPDVLSEAAQVARGTGADQATRAAVVSRSVLIVRQTRGAHQEIVDVIRRVKTGDGTDVAPGAGFGGGGFGGGGFGGGYFSTTDPKPVDAKRKEKSPAAK